MGRRDYRGVCVGGADMKPHKHAKLIEQWAQNPSQKVWMRLNEKDLVWEESHIIDVINDVSSNYIYCVGQPKKLSPVVRWLWANGKGMITSSLFSEEEIQRNSGPMIKLEWSRTEFTE